MKGITSPLIFLAILGAATSKVIKEEDTQANVDPFEIGECWYPNKMCVTAGSTPEDGSFVDPEACQSHCAGMTEEQCKYWVYKKPRDNAASCYALTTCDTDIENGCKPSNETNSHCASGPRECGDPCHQFKYQSGLKAHWNCIHTGRVVYPYQEDIPSGSTCTAKCPKWVNDADAAVGEVQTICRNGIWDAIDPVTKPVLPLPDTNDDAANPPCTCDDIKINIDSFADTENQGAELYCTDGSEGSDLMLKSGEVTISGSMNCIMLCDKLFVMEVTCSQGAWTDGHQEVKNCADFYCWKKPDEADCTFA